MQANELTDLVAGLSALAERFERRMQQVELDLKHLTRQVPDAIRESADTETRHLRESVMAQIDAGLQQPVSAYQQRLQEDSRHLQQAAQALSVQIHRMQALHRHLIWKMAGVALGSLALVVVGGGWLSTHYYDEVRRNQISAQLLKAYNTADVTLCGERLCANVETDSEGDLGQYRPVRKRP